MNIKEKILEMHYEMLHGKIDVFEDMIRMMEDEIQTGAGVLKNNNAEKRLAELREEQNMLRVKVEEALQTKTVLDRIDTKEKMTAVGFGSFVRINSIYIFVSTTLPKIFVEDIPVLAMSEDVPLVRMLWDKKIYDEITYNGSVFRINEIQ